MDFVSVFPVGVFPAPWNNVTTGFEKKDVQIPSLPPPDLRIFSTHRCMMIVYKVSH